MSNLQIKKVHLHSLSIRLHSRTKGFGLVEVLVSIVILTTVITGLSYLTTFMIRSANTAAHKTEALGYAQAIVEELKNEFRKDGELGATTSSCPSSATSCTAWRDEATEKGEDEETFNLFYGVSNDEKPKDIGTTSTDPREENYYRIDAKVTWDERGKTRQVHLTTYIGKVR